MLSPRTFLFECQGLYLLAAEHRTDGPGARVIARGGHMVRTSAPLARPPGFSPHGDIFYLCTMQEEGAGAPLQRLFDYVVYSGRDMTQVEHYEVRHGQDAMVVLQDSGVLAVLDEGALTVYDSNRPQPLVRRMPNAADVRALEDGFWLFEEGDHLKLRDKDFAVQLCTPKGVYTASGRHFYVCTETMTTAFNLDKKFYALDMAFKRPVPPMVQNGPLLLRLSHPQWSLHNAEKKKTVLLPVEFCRDDFWLKPVISRIGDWSAVLVMGTGQQERTHEVLW